MPCLSCQKSSSSPLNFLLDCISCANSWHHRCHSPPVSDKELISIIKAFNAEKHNPAAKLIWQCAKCIKAKNVNRTQLIAVKKTTPRHVAVLPPQKAIVIDIDDDVPKRTKLVSQSSTSLPHQSSTAASVDQLNIPHEPPPAGRTSCTKQIRIIDDPFLVPDPCQTSSSSKPQVRSGFIDLTISSDEEMNGGGDDDALEYLTPPPTPAPTSKQVVKIVEQVPLILTSNQAPPHPLPRDSGPTARTSSMTTSQPSNQLLIQWLNDRGTTGGVKPDLWTRACLRREQANRKSLQSKQSVQPIASPSRRKCKAHRLNEGSRTYSQSIFFLSAEGWLREKQA